MLIYNDDCVFLLFILLAYYYGQRLRKYISRGLIEQATDLLVRGCSVNTADGEGMTSLHYAANYNKPKALEALIKFYGSDFQHLEINRFNHLIALKSSKKKFNDVWVYLELKASGAGRKDKKQSPIIVDAKDKYGWTPLYCASHHGSMECAQLLLNDLGDLPTFVVIIVTLP